jgi:hypothetical protein
MLQRNLTKNVNIFYKNLQTKENNAHEKQSTLLIFVIYIVSRNKMVEFQICQIGDCNNKGHEISFTLPEFRNRFYTPLLVMQRQMTTDIERKEQEIRMIKKRLKKINKALNRVSDIEDLEDK